MPHGLGRRLAANTLHATSGRLAVIVVWVLFTPPILRALGPEGFGVWSLFYALTGYLSALDLGLVQGTLRHVAAARGRGDHAEAGAFATLAVAGYIVLGALWLVLAAAFTGGILAWLRIPAVVAGPARFAMLAGPIVFVAAGFANAGMGVLQGYDRFDAANRILIAVTAQQAAGMALVLHRGWGIRGLVVNVGVGWALGCVLALILLRTVTPEFRWQSLGTLRAHLGRALRFGGPMQVTNLLAVFNVHLDKILLSRFVALAAVAPYELGSRIAGTVASFPQFALLAVLPEAAALDAAGDRERMRALYRRASHYVLTLAAVLLAPLLAASDRLYAAWLGGGNGDAAMVLRGLTLNSGLALATGMGTSIARGIARTDLEAWYATVAVALHLALSLWLLPTLGLKGTLVAITIGNAVGAVLFLELLARCLDWSRTEVMGPALVPALGIAAGAAAGWGLDRVLPAAAGAAAWAMLALVAGTASAVALTVMVSTGYFHWREARTLIAA